MIIKTVLALGVNGPLLSELRHSWMEETDCLFREWIVQTV